jgi:hypothetical protein
MTGTFLRSSSKAVRIPMAPLPTTSTFEAMVEKYIANCVLVSTKLYAYLLLLLLLTDTKKMGVAPTSVHQVKHPTKNQEAPIQRRHDNCFFKRCF